MRRCIILIFAGLMTFSACGGGAGDDTVEPTPTQAQVPTDDPGVIDDPGIPEEDDPTMAKAILFYDGSVKTWDGKAVSKLRDASTCARAGKYFIFDTSAETLDGKTVWDIGQAADRATIWGGRLFLYADKRLYVADVKKAASEIAYNQYNHNVALTPDGVSFELSFFDETGAEIEGQYGGYESIMKLNKVGSIWYKYIYVAGSWIQVGQGNYADFVRCHSLDIDGVTYYTKGAILNREAQTFSEPSFNSVSKTYNGGSAFRKYIQPIVSAGDCKPHLIGIGVADGIGYFLNARTGQVVKYNPGTDTLTDWITLVDGTGTDDKTASEALFAQTAAFMCEREIIYYSAGKIWRLNIDTGEKNEIAEATGMRGWPYS